MLILAAYKARLKSVSAVTSLISGGIWIGRVGQNDKRPNILILGPEEGQDYSHDGPVGLLDAHIQVICRADTADAASALGDAVVDALEDWAGVQSGCSVQLSERFKRMSDFDNKAEVFRDTSEYTAFYTRI